MIGRRKLLALGTALGTVAVMGGGTAAFVLTDRYRGWLRFTLARSLPGYSLEPDGFERFVEDYNVRKPDSTKLRIFAAAERLTDANWALPGEMAADVEQEERRIVSDFLLGSDFFQNYPDGAKTITYAGMPEACSSPFATF
jgi:hypothetical protein